MSFDENHYLELTARAEQAFVEGDLEKAASLLINAEDLAKSCDDDEFSDQAFCRRSFILIELEQLTSEADLSRLKKILLRSKVTKTRWMAAYYTGMAYYVQGQREAAHSYAKRAMEVAPDLREPNCVAASANLLGNLQLIASDFDQAERSYRRALDCYQASGSFQEVMAAQLNDNLGYVCICNGRIEEGVRLCKLACETMESEGAYHFMHQALQDLCYGYLLLDRLEEARENGDQGLEIALELDDKLVAKNLYYLLAEIAVRSGDRFRARRYLSSLAACYPEIPASEEIIDVLMETDFSQVVNLRG